MRCMYNEYASNVHEKLKRVVEKYSCSASRDFISGGCITLSNKYRDLLFTIILAVLYANPLKT